MSLRRPPRDRAVFVMAMALLPWVAISGVGEWGGSTVSSHRMQDVAVERLLPRSVVMPDQVRFSTTGKRADGIRQVIATPRGGFGMLPDPRLGLDVSAPDAVLRTEPITLHPAPRGPPSRIPLAQTDQRNVHSPSMASQEIDWEAFQ
jgi:hypothetical protein